MFRKRNVRVRAQNGEKPAARKKDISDAAFFAAAGVTPKIVN